MGWIRARLTYSNVVASLALFLVLAGGTVYAANKISGSQIKKNSLAGNRLKNNTVKGKKIKESKLGTVPNAAHAGSANAVSGLKVITPIKRLAATDGATVDAARAAAPRTNLFRKGSFTIYAKCFRDTSANLTYAEVYAETTSSGSLLDGFDSLVGQNGAPPSGYLNPGTDERDRRVSSASTAADDAAATPGSFTLVGVGETLLRGQAVAAVKNGNPNAGNGTYGPGNRCLFGGFIIG